jgi:hypothetical protein
MNVFVNRDPTGCETFDLEDMNELEAQLGSFSAVEPLNDKSQVKVEITGTWQEIKELLSQPCFKNIWFDPRRSHSAVQAAKFEVGDKVQVVRLLDQMTSKELIGFVGTIREIDSLPNGDFNYYIDDHYMHEGELEFAY